MRSLEYKHNQTGFLLIATIVTLLVLSIISLALVETMRRESQVLTSSIQQNKSEAIAKAGMDRAIKFFSGIGDWSLSFTNLYTNVALDGGTFTVTTSNGTRDSIRIQSRGNYQNAITTLTQDLTIKQDPNYPGFLNINLSNMQVQGKLLVSTLLEDSRIYNSIWITHVKISTSANANNAIKKMKVNRWDWIDIWSGNASPGTLINVYDFWLPPVMPWGGFEFRAEFDHNIVQNGNITLEFRLSDGSTYSKTVPIP